MSNNKLQVDAMAIGAVLDLANVPQSDALSNRVQKLREERDALRAENAKLREALQYLLDDYRVRLFAIGHTYEDIDNSVVVQEARAALA